MDSKLDGYDIAGIVVYLLIVVGVGILVGEENKCCAANVNCTIIFLVVISIEKKHGIRILLSKQGLSVVYCKSPCTIKALVRIDFSCVMTFSSVPGYWRFFAKDFHLFASEQMQ